MEPLEQMQGMLSNYLIDGKIEELQALIRILEERIAQLESQKVVVPVPTLLREPKPNKKKS